MTQRTNLKPWSLAWLGTAWFLVLALFIAAVAVFMLFQTLRMPLPLMGKLSVGALCTSVLAFLVSTWKWTRHWRHVRWDVGFFEFVSGPEPAYEHARNAWRWGRRARGFWFATVASLVVLAAFVVGAQ
jgi:hypothetical protein